MDTMTLSAYRITWVEIRPLSGRKVTKADSHKMGGVCIRFNGFGYHHFGNKERAIAWLEEQKGKTFSKGYEARIFSDKQFGMTNASDGYAVPFTKKQMAEVYVF